jgi:hypothetical protein
MNKEQVEFDALCALVESLSPDELRELRAFGRTSAWRQTIHRETAALWQKLSEMRLIILCREVMIGNLCIAQLTTQGIGCNELAMRACHLPGMTNLVDIFARKNQFSIATRSLPYG